MQQQAPMSDGDYLNMWSSLNSEQCHTCSRHCMYKQVMGNLFICCTSGQAHVCDQNCNQRLFYDNHTDICRLSKRTFPRAAGGADMIGMEGSGPLARKRSGEEEAMLAEIQHLAKRSNSASWQGSSIQQQQQQLALQQAVVAAGWPQAQPVGWPSC